MDQTQIWIPTSHYIYHIHEYKYIFKKIIIVVMLKNNYNKIIIKNNLWMFKSGGYI